MSCERIVAYLNDLGVTISKRQVVRLLTRKLETFRAEDAEVLKVGLMGDYVSVDDTGARHAGRTALRRRSVRTDFVCSARGRANPGWRSCPGSAVEFVCS